MKATTMKVIIKTNKTLKSYIKVNFHFKYFKQVFFLIKKYQLKMNLYKQHNKMDLLIILSELYLKERIKEARHSINSKRI